MSQDELKTVLKQQRKKLGSLEEVARWIGCSYFTMRRWLGTTQTISPAWRQIIEMKLKEKGLFKSSPPPPVSADPTP